MAIYFIHGYNSGPDGATAKVVKQACEELGVADDLVCVDYAEMQDDPGAAYYKICGYLIDGDMDPIVVGHSYGGIFARAIASASNRVKLVMINPSLEPSDTLKDKLDPFSITVLQYLEERPLSREVRAYLALGMKDKIISPEYALETFSGRAYLNIDENGGHRPTLQQVKEVIHYAINHEALEV